MRFSFNRFLNVFFYEHFQKPARAPATIAHMHNTAQGSRQDSSTDARAQLRFVLILSAVVMLAEVVGAALSGSLTLLADAGHMMVDTSGLAIALFAAYLMSKPRTDTYTWGLARSEVISASVQASMLIVVCIAVTIEAIGRFFTPETVNANQMILFACIGLLANLIGIALLSRKKESSLNTRAAFLEVLNDAFGSIAVLAAAGVTMATGWIYADPVASLIVAALMAPRALRILVRCVKILMEGTPDELNLADVRTHILKEPHVIDVHDLHVSSITSTTTALTAHVTIEPDCFTNGEAVSILHSLQHCVSKHFPLAVGHCTIQLDVPAHRDHEHLHH